MTETATSLQQETVSGKRLLAAIGSAILAAAVIGGISYAAFDSMSQNVRVQAVTVLVYATLTATLCLFFRPATSSPISLRYTGANALAASVGVFVATVAVIVLFYYCLGSIFGSVPSVARQIVTFATDAGRLKGQPTAAWIIAIPRGCLLVPVFEEVFFRGLLFQQGARQSEMQPSTHPMIRLPQTRDYDRMAELAVQLGYPSTGQQIRLRLGGMLDSKDFAVYVAEVSGGQIAGWIGVYVSRAVEIDECAVISGLVVGQEIRSHGIGKMLLDAAEEWARSRGCTSISVLSNVTRDRAHGFYGRNRYEHVKTQKLLCKRF